MTSNQEEMINRHFLPGNDCFGCGHENEHGLQIAVFRDDQHQDRLIAQFTPKAHMIGFPGITHGGVIYTALDCLASWAPTILRSEIKAAWMLRSAEIKYLRPAHAGSNLMLSAAITKQTKNWRPIVVQTTVHNDAGLLLVEASFKVVPLTPEKLKELAGLEELPENWRRLLEKR